MPIETGIPSSLARPQVFHRFTYLKGGGQLVPLAQKVALLGAKISTGTATAAAVYDILSSEQGDILFGEGSEVALMIRQAFRTQRLLGRGVSSRSASPTRAVARGRQRSR
jgi:phage tail sheath gpL-like